MPTTFPITRFVSDIPCQRAPARAWGRVLACVAVAVVLCCPVSLAAEEAAAADIAAAKPFGPGDPFPVEGLPADWVRGEPVRRFEPGVAYVIAFWNTRTWGKRAPGYNIENSVASFANHPRLKCLVLYAQDDLPREKLAVRLGYPSQQTPFPVGMANKPDDPAVRLWLARMPRDERGMGHNTLVVRDGIVLWTGDGTDLSAETLAPFVAAEFDFKIWQEQRAASDARIKELWNVLAKEVPAADEAGDTACGEALLDTLEAEPNLHPFLYQRLRDHRAMRALKRGDVAGALAEMRKLAVKYPDDKRAQSWVHKVVSQVPELRDPGTTLCAEAAARAGELTGGDAGAEWLQVAAGHWQTAGDDAKALAALEAAEKMTTRYRRLEAYRAGRVVP